jgi:hypothetical protein
MIIRMRNSDDHEGEEVFQVLNRMRAETWQRWRARWMCRVMVDCVATETRDSSNPDHDQMPGDR